MGLMQLYALSEWGVNILQETQDLNFTINAFF